MPHQVPLVVYRNGERIVIGHALVNRIPHDGRLSMIARINDEVIIEHLLTGGDFGSAEFTLGEPDDTKTRIIKTDI